AVTGASTYADIQITEGTPTSAAAAVGHGKLIINSVRLITLQQLDWRVEFYRKNIVQATASGIFESDLIGSVEFYSQGTAASLGITRLTAAEGSRIATQYISATAFMYFSQNLNIPYEDKQNLGQLHTNLVNLNSTSKLPGDTGAVSLIVGTIAAS